MFIYQQVNWTPQHHLRPYRPRHSRLLNKSPSNSLQRTPTTASSHSSWRKLNSRKPMRSYRLDKKPYKPPSTPFKASWAQWFCNQTHMSVNASHHHLTQPPSQAPTEPKQRRTRPTLIGRVLTQPPVAAATGQGQETTCLPVFQLPVQPVQQQPTPILPILPHVHQAARPDLPLWTQRAHVSLPVAPGRVSLPATLTDLRTNRHLMDQAARTISINTQESTDSGKPPKSGLK